MPLLPWERGDVRTKAAQIAFGTRDCRSLCCCAEVMWTTGQHRHLNATGTADVFAAVAEVIWVLRLAYGTMALNTECT